MSRSTRRALVAAISIGAIAVPAAAEGAGSSRVDATACHRYRTNDQFPLRLCDKGEAVRQAQLGLRTVTPTLPADGFFGPHTHGAVLRYQALVGLETDDLVGPRTWRSITARFTCGTDRDGSGLIDPDEIFVDATQLTDRRTLLDACVG